jgi:hypothetical protein
MAISHCLARDLAQNDVVSGKGRHHQGRALLRRAQVRKRKWGYYHFTPGSTRYSPVETQTVLKPGACVNSRH